MEFYLIHTNCENDDVSSHKNIFKALCERQAVNAMLNGNNAVFKLYTSDEIIYAVNLFQMPLYTGTTHTLTPIYTIHLA